MLTGEMKTKTFSNTDHLNQLLFNHKYQTDKDDPIIVPNTVIYDIFLHK